MAWYYHLYGPVAFASSPAEEGYVSLIPAAETRSPLTRIMTIRA